MKHIAHGARLQCDQGTSPGVLSVLPANNALVGPAGLPLATIQDFAPKVNIGEFGMCTTLGNPVVAAATASHLGVLTPQPCKPATTTPWSAANSDVEIRGLPVLTEGSTCKCMWGGTIKPVSAGQETVTVGARASEAWRSAPQADLRPGEPRANRPPLDTHSDEKPVTLRILLCDEYQRPMPGAPYRLKAGGAMREGSADGQGILIEHDVSLKQECLLEWGAPLAAGGGAHEDSLRFAQTLRSGGRR